jgi:small conductance mechanosensitive channel
MNEITNSLSNAADLVLNKLSGWTETLIKMLPNLLVAILVVLLFWQVAKLVNRGARRGLNRVMENGQAAGLISTLLTLAVRIAGIFVALSILQLDKAVTSLLAGVGILGLALGFAFQDLAANFVSGVLMTVRRPFRIGDLVKIGDEMGVVEEVDLRTTSMRQLNGQLIIVPNRKVYENTLINFARAQARRVEVAVGVSYDDDLETAKAAAEEALCGLEIRTESRPVDVFYTGFGGSSIDMICRFWIDDIGQRAYLDARSVGIMAIAKAFGSAGVSIPFPIRTLELTESPALDTLIEAQKLRAQSNDEHDERRPDRPSAGPMAQSA